MERGEKNVRKRKDKAVKTDIETTSRSERYRAMNSILTVLWSEEDCCAWEVSDSLDPALWWWHSHGAAW